MRPSSLFSVTGCQYRPCGTTSTFFQRRACKGTPGPPQREHNPSSIMLRAPASLAQTVENRDKERHDCMKLCVVRRKNGPARVPRSTLWTGLVTLRLDVDFLDVVCDKLSAGTVNDEFVLMSAVTWYSWFPLDMKVPARRKQNVPGRRRA